MSVHYSFISLGIFIAFIGDNFDNTTLKMNHKRVSGMLHNTENT